jgi:hypothetical protein
MGVRILSDRHNDIACLFCSTSDVAFGPVFSDSDEHYADERAEAFTRWLELDARKYDEADLMRKYAEWQAQESAQWTREEGDAS